MISLKIQAKINLKKKLDKKFWVGSNWGWSVRKQHASNFLWVALLVYCSNILESNNSF